MSVFDELRNLVERQCDQELVDDSIESLTDLVACGQVQLDKKDALFKRSADRLTQAQNAMLTAKSAVDSANEKKGLPAIDGDAEAVATDMQQRDEEVAEATRAFQTSEAELCRCRTSFVKLVTMSIGCGGKNKTTGEMDASVSVHKKAKLESTGSVNSPKKGMTKYTLYAPQDLHGASEAYLATCGYVVAVPNDVWMEETQKGTSFRKYTVVLVAKSGLRFRLGAVGDTAVKFFGEMKTKKDECVMACLVGYRSWETAKNSGWEVTLDHGFELESVAKDDEKHFTFPVAFAALSDIRLSTECLCVRGQVTEVSKDSMNLTGFSEDGGSMIKVKFWCKIPDLVKNNVLVELRNVSGSVRYQNLSVNNASEVRLMKGDGFSVPETPFRGKVSE